MTKTLTITILLLTGICFAQEQYSRAKIWANANELQKLAELGLPVDHGTIKQNTFIESDFSQTSLDKAEAAGFQVEVLIEDVKAYYASEEFQNQIATKNATCPPVDGSSYDPQVPSNFQLGSMAGFYTYQEYLDILDDMVSQYPSLISAKTPVSDTLTHEGRPIHYVKISNDPNVDQGKPRVLYSSIHHAREPGSLSQTIFYMWYLLENYGSDPEITYLVDNLELMFVPMVNPDGYVHNVINDPNGGGMHRKNKNPSVGNTNPGVDLNRNYSYQWGTTGVDLADQNSDTYPGSGAFSEPETKNMKKIAENWDILLALNAHTYSALMLYPIGATSQEFAADDTYFDAISNHMVEYNGYEAMKSSGLYPASGDSDDYMYKDENIFAMTPEVSYDGFWVPQAQITPDCIDMVYPNIVLAHLALIYGVTTNLDVVSTINNSTGDFNYEIQRLGRMAGPLTVSVEPISGIQTVGNPVVYNLQIEEVQTGAISYELNAGIQYGDEVKYVLITDNGDWQYRDTIVKTYGSATLQFNDPAANLDNWTGDWALTTEDFYSADYSFTDSPNTNYSSASFSTFVFNDTIDLTAATAAAVRFRAKWDIEINWDYAQFQVSTDNGGTWVAQCGRYTNDGVQNSGNSQPVGEPLYDGTQSDWVLEEINLSDYLGEEVRFRFVLVADNFVQEDGFYFDDFEILYDLQTDASLGEGEVFAFNVFPNPASDQIKVAFDEFVSGGEIAIHNNMGQLVKSVGFTSQTNAVSVSTADLPQGVYHVTVNTGNKVSAPQRLIVVK
jgi:hypothetical protein